MTMRCSSMRCSQDSALPKILESRRWIGKAFLYVQAQDKVGDGRLRAAYAPKPLRRPETT